jgi:hypothetical protein
MQHQHQNHAAQQRDPLCATDEKAEAEEQQPDQKTSMMALGC